MPEIKFTLTAQHIQLIQRFYVGWQDCETGAPEIDPKRPYGNSAVAKNVAEILGIPFEAEDGLEHDEAEAKLLALHQETKTALQIVLCCKTFEPGEFVQQEYDRSWKRV